MPGRGSDLHATRQRDHRHLASWLNLTNLPVFISLEVSEPDFPAGLWVTDRGLSINSRKSTVLGILDFTGCSYRRASYRPTFDCPGRGRRPNDIYLRTARYIVILPNVFDQNSFFFFFFFDKRHLQTYLVRTLLH